MHFVTPQSVGAFGERSTNGAVSNWANAIRPYITWQAHTMTDTKKHLTHLETVGLIRLAKTHPELEFMFRHALVQEAAYNSLLFEDRKKLHRQVAEAMEETYPDRLDEMAAELARHYTVAGEEEKAVAYLLRAGDHSRQLVALNDAIEFYRGALERWPESDQAGQAEALRKLGECLWATGQDALETFEAGYTLFEALDDLEGAGAMQRMIGRIYWEKGERERSLQHYHQALTILEQGPESVELARAVSSISQMHMLASEYDQAISWGERALQLAQHLGAEDVTVHTLNNIGSSYISLGDLESGLTMLQDSRNRALALSLPHDACRAYYNSACCIQYLGRYAEARATLEELYTYATQIHASQFVRLALIQFIELDWLSGRWAATLTRHQHFLENPNLPDAQMKLWASANFGRLYNDLGQTQAAIQELEGTLTNVRNSGELQTIVPHLGQLARAYDAAGLEVKAAELIQEFLEWIDRAPYMQLNNELYLLFACQWQTAHSSSEALDDAQATLQRLKRADEQFGSPVTDTVLNEGRGSVALVEGNYSQAIVQLRHAIAGWKELGHAYDQARALKYLGQALAQSGEADEARDVFKQAYTIVETLAAQLDEAELKDSFLKSPLVREIKQGVGSRK